MRFKKGTNVYTIEIEVMYMGKLPAKPVLFRGYVTDIVEPKGPFIGVYFFGAGFAYYNDKSGSLETYTYEI